MEFENQPSLSLKQTLKTIYCTSCCNNNDEDDFQKSPEHSEKKRRSCCKWLKSAVSRFFSCKPGRNCRRKSSSSAFKYDALSYSLNFEDDDDSHLDEFPLRDFCSRLPPSPIKERNNSTTSSFQFLIGVN